MTKYTRKVLFWAALIATSFMLLWGCTDIKLKKSCSDVKTSKIVSVGGCDWFGTCGVLLENGSKRVIKYPVLGEPEYEESCR